MKIVLQKKLRKLIRTLAHLVVDPATAHLLPASSFEKLKQAFLILVDVLDDLEEEGS